MWETNYIETSRGRFEYFVAGNGEPIAITHFYMEFNSRGNLFANPFTKDYKVYLINVRGAANSAKLEDNKQLSLKEIILDLEDIREVLGLEKWAFAGHSTGGMLALQYAIEAPQSLTKVVAGCTAASKAYASHPNSIYSPSNDNYSRTIEIMELLKDSSTLQEERKSLSYEWALMSYHSEENLKSALLRPNSGLTIGRNLDYFRKVVVQNFDLREQLASIQVPTFIFAGKHDAQCPVEFGTEIVNLIPNASLTIFEISNHNPFIEEEEAFKRFVKLTV
ncbi:alpha/beta fold hydrolase [Solibacillus sp. FSL K6-1523]|uniref:alpha/beta fold hydrolase n=1 Tax=Solibacillus sp. FSL K6-1523 TaxID=2921471 RepID=UPI0030F8E5B0